MASSAERISFTIIPLCALTLMATPLFTNFRLLSKPLLRLGSVRTFATAVPSRSVLASASNWLSCGISVCYLDRLQNIVPKLEFRRRGPQYTRSRYTYTKCIHTYVHANADACTVLVKISHHLCGKYT